MGAHWTSYMMGQATQAQADYLDQLAAQADRLRAAAPTTPETAKWRELCDGRGVLAWCGVKGAPSKAEASAAIDTAKEKIAKREAVVAALKSGSDPRAEALTQIRALMAKHGITREEV